MKLYNLNDIKTWFTALQNFPVLICCAPPGYGRNLFLNDFLTFIRTNDQKRQIRYYLLPASFSENTEKRIIDLIIKNSQNELILFFENSNNLRGETYRKIIELTKKKLDCPKLIFSCSTLKPCTKKLPRSRVFISAPPLPDKSSAKKLLYSLTIQKNAEENNLFKQKFTKLISSKFNQDLLAEAIPALTILQAICINELFSHNSDYTDDDFRALFRQKLQIWLKDISEHSDNICQKPMKRLFQAIENQIFTELLNNPQLQIIPPDYLRQIRFWLIKRQGKYLTPSFLPELFRLKISEKEKTKIRHELIQKIINLANPTPAAFLVLSNFHKKGFLTAGIMEDFLMEHRFRLLTDLRNEEQLISILQNIKNEVANKSEIEGFIWEIINQNELKSDFSAFISFCSAFSRHRIQAKYFMSARNFPEALKEWLLCHRFADNEKRIAECLIHQSICHAFLDEMEKSLEIIASCRKINIKDRLIEGFCTYWEGYLHAMQNNSSLAKKLFQEACLAFEEEVSTNLYLLNQKACINLLLNEYDLKNVRWQLQKLKDFCPETDNPAAEIAILRIESLLSFWEKNYEQVYLNAEKLLKTDSVTAHILACEISSISAMRQKKLKNAERNMRLMELLIKEGGVKKSLNTILWVRSLFEIISGQEKELVTNLTILADQKTNKHLFRAIISTWLLSVFSKTDTEAINFHTRHLALLESVPQTMKEVVLDWKEWLREYLKNSDSAEVFIGGKKISLNYVELKGLRKQYQHYNLFLDFPENRFFRHGKALTLNNKKKLRQVLFYFCQNIGKVLDNKTLFTEIWKNKFDPETDVYTIRTTINRLRTILCPDTEKHNQPLQTVEGKKGAYIFCLQNNDCIIFPKSLTPASAHPKTGMTGEHEIQRISLFRFPAL